MPCLPFIVGVEDLLSGRKVLRHDDQTTMISELINVCTLSDLTPVEATVARHVGTQMFPSAYGIKALTSVTNCYNQANSAVLGVGWSENTIAGVNLEVQRAILIRIAVYLLAIVSNCRRLDQLPLASLIVSYVSADVLLDIISSLICLSLSRFLRLCLLLIHSAPSVPLIHS